MIRRQESHVVGRRMDGPRGRPKAKGCTGEEEGTGTSEATTSKPEEAETEEEYVSKTNFLGNAPNK